MAKKQGEFYTLQEVADYLRVSRQTIYNYVTQKKLRAFKLGGQREYRVSKEDLQDFISSNANR